MGCTQWGVVVVVLLLLLVVGGPYFMPGGMATSVLPWVPLPCLEEGGVKV
jgi:hypothetical protein